MCGLAGIASAAIPDAERQALIALYNSTDGANWTVRDNWRNPGDTDFNDPGTECTWHGITCLLGNAVKIIDLRDNNLSGSLPPELGDFPNLERLNLEVNELTGSIPPELGNLSNLQQLWLGYNDLTGSIPSQLRFLSDLVMLALARNQLTESIPPELGDLSNLQRLDLENNELTGSIPPELGDLLNLELIFFEANQLTGSIPPELGSLVNLKSLWLDANQLTGSIPPELGSLTNLEDLSLVANHLTGTIPPELRSLSNLRILDLGGNQLSGSIPPQLGDLSNLYVLLLGRNQLSGSIPASLGNCSGLIWLGLQSNQLTGSIPPELEQLTSLWDSDGLRLRWNAVHSSNAALIAFLDSKQSGGDWQSTQTIAPLNLVVGAIRDHTVWLSWDAVTYTQDGGYELYVKETTSSQWLLSGATDSKTTTIFPVTGLDPATQYDFAVKTYTNPHASNQNRVLSDLSSVVTATTADTGSIAPVIRKSGTSPWTLFTTEIFDSYLWSTGETTRIISVDPSDTTWYWVTTTLAGSSDESATVLVDPNLPAEIFADGFEGGTTAEWSTTIP